ncbi:MAG: diguanylate cyclase [Actinobacteria bacterium]|nr:MAG: diguanylate cyclase [Actinomycetota bacterium]
MVDGALVHLRSPLYTPCSSNGSSVSSACATPPRRRTVLAEVGMMARVLVVDDAKEPRLLLRKILERDGHEVVEAEDGLEALSRLRETAFDLVVSDGLMPHMDGFRLRLEMRRDPGLAAVPFIFHTASFIDEADERLARDLGATAYLIKPASTTAVLEAVAEGLAVRGVATGSAAPELEESELARLLEGYSHRLEDKLDDKVVELRHERGEREAVRAALDHIPVPVLTLDAAGRVDFVNREARRFELGIEPAEPSGFDDEYAADEIRDTLSVARRCLAERRVSETTARLRRQDGRVRTMRVSIAPYEDSAGEPLGVVCAGADVTDQMEYVDLLRYLSEHDPLTDLPNRRVLESRFERLVQGLSSGSTGALLFVDVDHFKQINDEFGHDVGDAALVNIARTVRASAPREALVARLCGDEFGVLVEDVGRRGAQEVAETIREAVSVAQVVPAASSRQVTVSIGVNVFPDSETAAQALRTSDEALYRAKHTGRDRTEVVEAAKRRPADEPAPTPAITFRPMRSTLTGELVRLRACVDLASEPDSASEPGALGGPRATRATVEPLAGALLESAAGVAISMPLGLGDMLDPAVFGRLQEEVSRRGADPRCIALEVPAAHVLGCAPSETWIRAAGHSGFAMCLAVDETCASVAALPLSVFSELWFPASVLAHLKDSTGGCDAALAECDARGVTLVATGVDTRECLALVVEAGVEVAEGLVIGPDVHGPSGLAEPPEGDEVR